MKALTIRNRFQRDTTLVENDFIDYYMVKANGEYVKVYLFLLRHLSNPGMVLTLSTIADCLENTEKDIVRALKYWEKEQLLTIHYDEAGKVTGLEIGKALSSTPAPVNTPAPVKEPEPIAEPPKKTVAEKEPVKTVSRKELKQLLFIAEQYLGKTLTKTDVDTITYICGHLGFSADLVEYLIEYCVENNHKSIHYIEKVALAWADDHITTVDEAKKQSESYNKNCFAVLNAFGIKGRSAAPVEIDFIKTWTNTYGFTLDMILVACDRTMAAIHQPSFEYTDTILKKWKLNNVHHLEDVKALDLAHQQVQKKKPASKLSSKNKFNNFEGRSYDLDSLECQLLNSK